MPEIKKIADVVQEVCRQLFLCTIDGLGANQIYLFFWGAMGVDHAGQV